jgi:hypothetical protein
MALGVASTEVDSVLPADPEAPSRARSHSTVSGGLVVEDRPLPTDQLEVVFGQPVPSLGVLAAPL